MISLGFEPRDVGTFAEWLLTLPVQDEPRRECGCACGTRFWGTAKKCPACRHLQKTKIRPKRGSANRERVELVAAMGLAVRATLVLTEGSGGAALALA